MPDLTRVRAFVRRVFFWLGPERQSSSEQLPESARDHALVLSVVHPRPLPRWRQLRYAGRVLNPAERRWFALAAAGGLLFAAGGLALLAWQHAMFVPVAGGTYTEAEIGEPQAINPVDAPANDADADLTALIYSGLFRMRGLEPVPDLAEKYSWSDDGKTLDITLRSDARFHNGQPVTTDDVQYTIESIQDPARNSLLAPLFRGVSVTVLDSRRMQFTLTQPDTTFLTALTVGILPSDLWQDVPAAAARLANINIKPVGSGPYRVKSFTRDNLGQIHSYTLERFDGYYGVKPFISTLTLQFFPDTQSAEDALKSDLVDGLAFVLPLETDRFKSASRWNTVALEIPQQMIAFFNLKNKLLQDARVREALAMSVSRQELADALDGHAVASDTPYPFQPTASATSSNLEGARKLLDAAGWVLPTNDNVRILRKSDAHGPAVSTASSTKLTLSLLTPDQQDLTKVADTLKRQWSLLGIQVVVSAMDEKTVLRKSSRDRNGQVILWNVLLGADQDLFPVWWSGQTGDRGMNFSGLTDKDVDNAITATKSATSTDALGRARRLLSDTLLKRAAAAFLLRPQYGYIVSTRIKGVPTDIVAAQPSDRWNGIADWYVKTGLRWK